MFVLQQAQQKTVTPMQWSKEANAGFTTGTPWLQPNTGYQAKNLDVSRGLGVGMGGGLVGTPVSDPAAKLPTVLDL